VQLAAHFAPGHRRRRRRRRRVVVGGGGGGGQASSQVTLHRPTDGSWGGAGREVRGSPATRPPCNFAVQPESDDDKRKLFPTRYGGGGGGGRWGQRAAAAAAATTTPGSVVTPTRPIPTDTVDVCFLSAPVRARAATVSSSAAVVDVTVAPPRQRRPVASSSVHQQSYRACCLAVVYFTWQLNGGLPYSTLQSNSLKWIALGPGYEYPLIQSINLLIHVL